MPEQNEAGAGAGADQRQRDVNMYRRQTNPCHAPPPEFNILRRTRLLKKDTSQLQDDWLLHGPINGQLAADAAAGVYRYRCQSCFLDAPRLRTRSPPNDRQRTHPHSLALMDGTLS